MKEQKNFPRPSIEVLRQFEELHNKVRHLQPADEQYQEVIDKLNGIIESYDLDNYVFEDPATGKKGVNNPAGQAIVPAEYDDFAYVGNQCWSPVSHVSAKKDGFWGIVTADGTNKVLCDFRFDQLQWNPYIGMYLACWDGVKDKFGFVSDEGKEFIPNVLTQLYEPCNDFMLLESDGKYGALDIRTSCFVLPEYDEVDCEPEEDILFHKDGVAGYVVEDTGEFVPKDQFEENEKYADAYIYNARVNV